MLRVMRATAWLAPVAAMVATAFAMLHADDGYSPLVAGLAAFAGAATMTVLTSAYFTYRLRRLTRNLRATLAGHTTQLPVRGLPVERELADAFNTAASEYAKIETRSRRDRLTGVLNRETILTELAREVERSNRHRLPLSVAFVDIDRFKAINDTHGHNSGDAVLRQVADLIGANVRSTDILGRYGGEEFMLVLPQTDPEAAATVTEKLRILIMETPLRIADGSTIKATISAGIAGDTGSDLRLDRLVDDADGAMYAAKSLGRNQTYVFRSVAEEARVRRAPIAPQRREQAMALGRWASQQTATALTSVLAPHAHYAGKPSERIAALATGVAMEMGLPEADVERIRFASLIHDLGKLAIEPDILEKPGALTEFEWQAIIEHPRIGQLVLEQATNLREAVPIVLHHHEHFNGQGYPHGLKARDIPIGARIVAVADAYDAMISDRPYQERRSHEEAIAELRRCAGTQFDPDVVERFCALFSKGLPAQELREAAAG